MSAEPEVVVFSDEGTFQAMYAAEQWCADRGISVGHNQRGAPRGLLRGDFDIQKWRNLRIHERDALDGRMTGDMRNGPVTIRLHKRVEGSAITDRRPYEPGAAIGVPGKN